MALRFWLKLGLFFVAVITISCFFAPFFKLVFDLLGIICPSLKDVLSFELKRIVTRIIMLFTLGGIFLFYNELGFQPVKELIFGFSREKMHLFVVGFILGIGALLLLTAIVVQQGAYQYKVRSGLSTIIFLLFKYGIAALLIGFIEELFFRGIILQTLIRKKSLWVALVSTNLFYAFVHFFQGDEIRESGHIALSSGFLITYELFKDIILGWHTVFPSFIGLFFLGLVFSYAFIRSGSLLLSIGLHAGFVFFVKSDSLFIDNTAKLLPQWLFSGNQIVSGMLSWVMLGCVGIIIYVITRRTKVTI